MREDINRFVCWEHSASQRTGFGRLWGQTEGWQGISKPSHLKRFLFVPKSTDVKAGFYHLLRKLVKEKWWWNILASKWIYIYNILRMLCFYTRTYVKLSGVDRIRSTLMDKYLCWINFK
jgi:hypothetical protein